MLSTVHDSTSLLPNPHAPLDSITSNNENFTIEEVPSSLEKSGKPSKKVTDSILEELNNKDLSKLQPASKTISKGDKPKTKKPHMKNKIEALLNNDLSSDKLPPYKSKPEKKNKNMTPTQRDGEGTLSAKKELKISDFFKQNSNPILKNSEEKIEKEANNEQNSTEIEVETHAESQEEKAESVELDQGVPFDFDVQRIWYDCGQKDVLFEFTPNKGDEEARSIVSRRDLAKKDSCLLVSFYEKYLDFSQFPNVNVEEFKLKPAIRAQK